MAEENGRVVRRHKQRSDDGKGLRRLIAEKRFRLPVGVSGPEAEQRFLLIERLWRDNEAFCRKIHREAQWTEIALWAAESIRHGTPRIPLPPIDNILASYGESPWPISIRLIIDRFTDETLQTRYPATVDGLEWDEVRTFFDSLSDSFPSVNWLLPLRASSKDFRLARFEINFRTGSVASRQERSSPAWPCVMGFPIRATSSCTGVIQTGLGKPCSNRNGSIANTLPQFSFQCQIC
jgi:hypothetical protein